MPPDNKPAVFVSSGRAFWRIIGVLRAPGGYLLSEVEAPIVPVKKWSNAVSGSSIACHRPMLETGRCSAIALVHRS